MYSQVRLYWDKRAKKRLDWSPMSPNDCTTTSSSSLSSLRLIGWLNLTVIIAFWNICKCLLGYLTLFIIYFAEKIIHILKVIGIAISSYQLLFFFIEAMRKDFYLRRKKNAIKIFYGPLTVIKFYTAIMLTWKYI